ncbi:uncharacterized protein LOC116182794 isoform X1 [Photinus pyralis]|uniref:uncharacterized protein LOC116182794 isoform X1 n=1 Tax=Photinus pyralis TaxID=7054 RepID=UPI001267305B|nr:uncharacterized protein LOC116182794 isoform X1 [Photinus pyralis]
MRTQGTIMESSQGYICFKCKENFFSHKNLIKHIKISHFFLTEYRCEQLYCFRSYKDLNGLRKHFQSQHDNLPVESLSKNTQAVSKTTNISSVTDHLSDLANFHSGSSETTSTSVPAAPQNYDLNNETNIRSFITNYMCTLYSNTSVNRSVVQFVIENTKILIDKILTHIFENFSEANVTTAKENLRYTIKNILCLFETTNSEHQRLKLLEKCESFIKPFPFTIGITTCLNRIDTSEEATLSVREARGQKVCIRTVLKKFLELPNVLNKIDYFVQSQEEISSEIVSIFQGELWKSLKSRFINKKVFPIYIFFDDFEPINPLGSRAGIYKIGGVYLSLACIPFEFASLIENIFLVQLFYSSDRARHGNKKIFESLIDDLIFLEREGIYVDRPDGIQEKIYFTLFLILGDNLGLNSILGFNESFNSDHFCRICLATKQMSQVEVDQLKFILRSKETYNSHSTNFSHGVKESCIWNVLPNFHVTNNICCDMMHDVLEGILRYDMAFVINSLIRKKYFSLDHLNERIKFFKFSKADAGNPMPQIKSDHLKKNHIVMSASEILSLTVYFSFLVGDLVPPEDEIWIFYIITVQILEMMLNRVFTTQSIAYLSILIEEHHTMFIELFKQHLRPKYHILLHYPSVIRMIGPPRHYWSMRFEGFHKLLKSTANNTASRKNLLVTLSIKQQLRLSSRLANKKGLECEKRCGPCSTVNTSHTFKNKFSNKAVSVPWVNINHVLFKKGFFLSISDDSDETDGLVTFGKIIDIIIESESIFFLLSIYVTVGFSTHFQAYEVSKLSKNTLIIHPFQSLQNNNVYNNRVLGDGRSFISMIK